MTPIQPTVPARSAMSPSDWAQLLLLSILWGGSFIFNRVAVAELQPITVVFGRAALAALALHLFVLAQGRRMPPPGRIWLVYLIMGLLNSAIPHSLIVWAQTQISASLASILNATTPLWTVLLAHLLTSDERLTRPRLAGVLLGLAGVVVMVGPGAREGLVQNTLAQMAILAAAGCYALAAIFGRRLRGRAADEAAAGQLTASTLVLLPVMLIADRPWRTLPHAHAGPLLAVLGLAILSTAVAYILYFRILASAGATNIALVTFLIPVSALLLGATLLGERLEPHQYAGMALIGLGLAAIDGRLLQRLRSRRNLMEAFNEST